MKLPVLLFLTREEKQTLRDVLDVWSDGQREAHSEIWDDPTIEDPDDTMSTLTTVEEEIRLCERVRAKL